MNWLRYIKEHGVAFQWTWRFGRYGDKKCPEPVCQRCKKTRARHWTESHEFIPPPEDKKEIV